MGLFIWIGWKEVTRKPKKEEFRLIVRTLLSLPPLILTKTHPPTTTQKTILYCLETHYNLKIQTKVDLDAITNANTLANEAKLPEKERKALIKNQTEQLLIGQNSSSSNRSRKH